VGCWPVHSTARIPLGRFKIIGAESQTGKNCASALALDDFHPSHNCPAVTIGPPFPSTKQIRSVVKRPKFVGRCLGPGRARKFHTHWHARTAKKTYQMCNIQKDHRAPGVLPADLSTFTHANNRATWTSPPQLLLVYRKDAQTQRVGRARSPLRAGVAHADPASRPESGFSALLRARLRAAGLLVREARCWFWMRRAEDCQPYRRSGFVETARAPPGRSKFCIEEQRFVRAGFCARSGYTKLCTTWKSSINRTERGAGAPRSKNFSSNPSQ